MRNTVPHAQVLQRGWCLSRGTVGWFTAVCSGQLLGQRVRLEAESFGFAREDKEGVKIPGGSRLSAARAQLRGAVLHSLSPTLSNIVSYTHQRFVTWSSGFVLSVPKWLAKLESVRRLHRVRKWLRIA